MIVTLHLVTLQWVDFQEMVSSLIREGNRRPPLVNRM